MSSIGHPILNKSLRAFIARHALLFSQFILVAVVATWLNSAPDAAMGWVMLLGGVALVYGGVCALVSANRLRLIRGRMAQAMSNPRRNLRGLAVSERMRFRALYAVVVVCAALMTLAVLQLYAHLSIAVFVSGFAGWLIWHGLASVGRMVVHDRAVATAFTPRAMPNLWPPALLSTPLAHDAQVTAAIASIYGQTGQAQAGRDALAVLYEPSAYFPDIQQLMGRSLPMTMAWLSRTLVGMAPAAALAGLIAVLLFASIPRHDLPRLPSPAAFWADLTTPDDLEQDLGQDDEQQVADSEPRNGGAESQPQSGGDENSEDGADQGQSSGAEGGANDPADGGDPGGGAGQTGDDAQPSSGGTSGSGNGEAANGEAGQGEAGLGEAGLGEAETADSGASDAADTQAGEDGAPQDMAKPGGSDGARSDQPNPGGQGVENANTDASGTAQNSTSTAAASPDTTPSSGQSDGDIADEQQAAPPGENGSGQVNAAPSPAPPSGPTPQNSTPSPETGIDTDPGQQPTGGQGDAPQPNLGAAQQPPLTSIPGAGTPRPLTPDATQPPQDRGTAGVDPAPQPDDANSAESSLGAAGEPAQGQHSDAAQRDAPAPAQNQPPGAELRAPSTPGTAPTGSIPQNGSADAPHPFSASAQLPTLLELTLSAPDDTLRIMTPLPTRSPALPGWMIDLLTP